MSLLGYGIAGGISGIGKGLSDVAAHERKLEGERLRDEYLMKRVKQQQEFQKGQVSEGRDFQRDERISGQDFRSDEAGKGRVFQKGQTGEDREFRAGEAERGRNFQREENRKAHALRRELAKLPEGSKPLTISEEKDARKMLAEKFSRLMGESLDIYADDPDNAAIKEIQQKIDHYINTWNDTGKWPNRITVTEPMIEAWMEKGESYQEVIQYMLELGYIVPSKFQSKAFLIEPVPSHIPGRDLTVSEFQSSELFSETALSSQPGCPETAFYGLGRRHEVPT